MLSTSSLQYQTPQQSWSAFLYPELLRTADRPREIDRAQESLLEKTRIPLIHCILVPQELHSDFFLLIWRLRMAGRIDLRSAISIPSDPNSIFLEEITSNHLSILGSEFSQLFPENFSRLQLMRLNSSNVLTRLCNSIRGLRITVGSLVHLNLPSYHRDPAQIVEIDLNQRTVIVRFWPRIDYALLAQRSIFSQRLLNSQMPLYYRAPEGPFQPSQLKGSRFGKSQMKIMGQSVSMVVWDETEFLGSFLYHEFLFQR
jgi:hypothetical protein